MKRFAIIMLLLQLLLTITAILVVLHWQHIDISVQCNQPIKPANIFNTT